MEQNKESRYFLLLGLAAILVVSYFIIKPFLSVLIFAVILAFLIQPLYRRVLHFTGKRRNLAATITMIISIIIILIPLAFLGVQIFKESSQLYSTLASGGKSGLITMFENGIDQARVYLPIPESFHINFSELAQQGLDILIKNVGSFFSGLAGIILNLFVFLIAFYFLLKDGGSFKNYLIGLSPLADTHDEAIASRLKSAVTSVVKGNLIIAIIQGVLTGVGLMIFGVPNAVLWGSVAALAALIPGVGTALVLLPAIAYLFVTGSTLSGTGMLIWGFAAVGLVDNFLGPRLVGRGMKMHPLLVFLAVLGGISFFGPLGFLFGPLIISLCLALIDIYSSLKADVVSNT